MKRTSTSIPARLIIRLALMCWLIAFALPPTSTADTYREAANPPAEQPATPESVSDANAPTTAPGATYTTRLPLVYFPAKLSNRLGFGVATSPIARYPELTSLRAGWYVDWKVSINPERPWGMEFVQTVRLHQKLTCALGTANAYDRAACPYVVPYDYYIFPGKATITEAAKANRGAIWLIGNEMDRRDWPGGGQDEMLPELYAIAYHDLYTHIKSVDPTARIAIGGVIQATPLRLEYLTKAWNHYQATYGQPMPVDIWNVHNFILQERKDGYGASIPPGSSATVGVTYPDDNSHINMLWFGNQIRAFRQWMKDRGQQNKPLIVSEYGVLLFNNGLENQTTVENFMIETFNHFLNTKDCNLGLPSDACRLVQRWNWYSLDDPSADFNEFGRLFNPWTLQITPTGAKYRTWSLTNIDLLKY